jgi:hypothetical protein
MKKTLSLLVVTLATASLSFAGQVVSSKKVVLPSDDCRFRANEWQVDISATGKVGNSSSNYNQGVGGNLGVNYFFTKYIGIGVDDSVGGTARPGQTSVGYDSLQADLLARYPICSLNLAPYVMVGGGASWATTSQGNGNVGGGLEYRLTKNVALFGDCRWLFGSNGSGYLSQALPRAGLRLAF